MLMHGILSFLLVANVIPGLQFPFDIIGVLVEFESQQMVKRNRNDDSTPTFGTLWSTFMKLDLVPRKSTYVCRPKRC